jgi:4-amino-4-deoxy-L-arabinose transferase-like glycosyltransferase
MPRSVSWKLLHSLWLLPALLFGMGTWLSFGYIAARHRRLSWMFTAVVYLVLGVTAFALAGSGSDKPTELDPDPMQTTIGVAMLFLLWPAGVLHALWVNMTVRLRLRAEKDSDPTDFAVPGAAPSAQSYPFR